VNGKFLDPAKESAVVGVIATGLFDRIPGSKLVSPKAFTERRCQIPYSVALALREAGVPVCAESVSDFIEKNRLDGELQCLLDPSNTVHWREKWPEFYDSSLAFCSGTGPVEYSLTVLGELYEKREELAIARRMEAGDLSREGAIEALRALGPEIKGNLFVNLRKIIDAGLEPERATIAEILPGTSLLYAGRLNEIHSEPGLGKTNVGLSIARCVIEDGGHVIWLDPEDTPAGTLKRLASFGADVAALEPSFHYVHNPTPDDFSRAIAYAAKNRQTLVHLDGLAEALAAEGKDENNVSDVLIFFRERLRPFADQGAAVLIADHVTKSPENRGRWARGSGAKLGRYDGVSYSVELIRAYSPKMAGQVRLRISKDRNGGVGAAGQVVVEIHFTPESDLTRVDFKEPADAKAFKPTTLMAKICQHIECFPDASKNDLRKLGSHEWVDKAIAHLVSDAFMRITKEGKRLRFEILKEYSEDI
jgi:hypothetical protein